MRPDRGTRSVSRPPGRRWRPSRVPRTVPSVLTREATAIDRLRRRGGCARGSTALRISLGPAQPLSRRFQRYPLGVVTRVIPSGLGHVRRPMGEPQPDSVTDPAFGDAFSGTAPPGLWDARLGPRCGAVGPLAGAIMRGELCGVASASLPWGSSCASALAWGLNSSHPIERSELATTIPLELATIDSGGSRNCGSRSWLRIRSRAWLVGLTRSGRAASIAVWEMTLGSGTQRLLLVVSVRVRWLVVRSWRACWSGSRRSIRR